MNLEEMWEHFLMETEKVACRLEIRLHVLRNQVYLESSESNYPTIASSGCCEPASGSHEQGTCEWQARAEREETRLMREKLS